MEALSLFSKEKVLSEKRGEIPENAQEPFLTVHCPQGQKLDPMQLLFNSVLEDTSTFLKK